MRRVAIALVVLLAFAPTANASLVQRGEALYGQYCLRCHHLNGSNVAPSLRGVGALAADFYLRTGYMPLPHLGVQPRRSRLILSPPQIEALIAYVASLGKGPPVPTPHPERGHLAIGMHLFTDHCAGCHQIAAAGGYVTGAVPPPLEDDTPTQIAEAVRIGPNVMPRFTTKAISNAQLDSIVAYVQYTKHPDDRGGWSLGHVGPIPEGLVAWFVGAAALVAVCFAIGRRLTSE